MIVTNNCDNSNIKVFYKQNTVQHNHIKFNNKILTDGITIQKYCNLNITTSGDNFIDYMLNSEFKTIIVKSHLPNIGYYDIIINDKFVNDIAISENFYNNYNNNILNGLIINKIFSVQGEVLVKGDITAFSTTIPSDIRLKKDIKEITNGLEIINKLRPVSFKWKKNNKESIGFIAQEIELILPHFVKDTKLDGIPIKTIKQDKLIPYIVDSIKNISNRLKKYESI
tara:strand:+ start:5470 stop:6147 length:678 start_codon:yes stop_codon:yes gene_type:complete